MSLIALGKAARKAQEKVQRYEKPLHFPLHQIQVFHKIWLGSVPLSFHSTGEKEGKKHMNREMFMHFMKNKT